MTSAVLYSAPVSRPKVHRLPARLPETPTHRAAAAAVGYGTVAKIAFSVSSVALVALLALFFSGGIFSGAALKQDVVVKAAIPVDSTASSFDARSVVLKEKNGEIIGQMARIVPAEPPSEVGTSEVDNRKARELLSIVDK